MDFKLRTRRFDDLTNWEIEQYEYDLMMGRTKDAKTGEDLGDVVLRGDHLYAENSKTRKLNIPMDNNKIYPGHEPSIKLRDILDGKYLYIKKELKPRIMLGEKIDSNNELCIYLYPKINFSI